MEEWVAIGGTPFELSFHFDEFETRNHYKGPVLRLRHPDHYGEDQEYVDDIEKEAVKVLGKYEPKEHEARTRALNGQKRVNRVFDSMGVHYGNHVDPTTSSSEGATGAARGGGARCGRRGTREGRGGRRAEVASWQ